MKVTILEFPTSNDWMEVKRRALVTVGLKPVTEPDHKWKFDILMAKHSPIRRLRFSFLLEDVPSYVSVHLVRHVHAQPYVKSQRNDRQSDYDRTKAPQDAPVDMIWDMNAEELITIFEKRLCGQADPKTRELVQMIADAVIERDELWEYFAQPTCQKIGVCFEMRPCGRMGELTV